MVLIITDPSPNFHVLTFFKYVTGLPTVDIRGAAVSFGCNAFSLFKGMIFSLRKNRNIKKSVNGAQIWGKTCFHFCHL